MFFFFTLLFLVLVSASNDDPQLKSQILNFTQHNLISSYYYLLRNLNTIKEDCTIFERYRDAVRDFFSKSPKECLTLVNDARDNFFSSLFIAILSTASNTYPQYRIEEHFRVIGNLKFSREEKLAELSKKFRQDCDQLAKDLWLIPFKKEDQNEYLERIEAFEILLYIMRRLAAVLKEGWIRQSLYNLNRTLKFVLRNFKVNTDYIPSYEGFLTTFNTLSLLSREQKGVWPSGSDLTAVVSLIKLFRYYSHHFSHNHFNELPATAPPLLLSLMLVESRYLSYILFSRFSQDPLGDLQVSFDSHPFSDLYSRITPFYLERRMKNQKTTKFSKNLCEERGFFIFLRELITLEPEITLEVKDGPPIALYLSEKEKWLIKVFLKLKLKRNLH